jgi:hypothetical protein
MIDVNSRVIVRVFNGEFAGTVLEAKYTTLAELNPEAPVNPDKPAPTEFGMPVNTQMPITLYTVQLDENPEYTGPNPLKTYNFIKEIL